MRYYSLLMILLVGLVLLITDGIPPGVGCLLLLVVIIILKIDKQQKDVREIAAALAFIALVLKGDLTKDETDE
jgi:hypothetical protein